MTGRICLSVAVSALALIACDGAFAQTTDQGGGAATQSDAIADASDADNQIVVTGIRRSLERAADIKRESVQLVDAIVAQDIGKLPDPTRSEEHTSELQSLMRISYAVFCLKKKTHTHILTQYNDHTLITLPRPHSSCIH